MSAKTKKDHLIRFVCRTKEPGASKSKISSSASASFLITHKKDHRPAPQWHARENLNFLTRLIFASHTDPIQVRRGWWVCVVSQVFSLYHLKLVVTCLNSKVLKRNDMSPGFHTDNVFPSEKRGWCGEPFFLTNSGITHPIKQVCR